MTTKLVLWDMDGTLSDDRHRDYLRQEQRWSEYFSYDQLMSDSPYMEALALYRELKGLGWTMGYLTARLERNRQATEDWLSLHKFDNPTKVMMRPEDKADVRPPEFKAAVLRSLLDTFTGPLMFVENDPEVRDYIDKHVGPDLTYAADWDQNPQSASINPAAQVRGA